MAFWLARSAQSQERTFMQRFDPRFWTVNFPRPAMASVVTILFLVRMAMTPSTAATATTLFSEKTATTPSTLAMVLM